MEKETLLLPARDPERDRESIALAGRILREGGIVAIPTETVYGLAGNALDPAATGRIYAAKGRPSDNPLIVHIQGMEEWPPLVKEVPPEAKGLAERFWPRWRCGCPRTRWPAPSSGRRGCPWRRRRPTAPAAPAPPPGGTAGMT